MHQDEDDLVTQYLNQDWDRKQEEEARKSNQELERAFRDSGLQNALLLAKKEAFHTETLPLQEISDKRNEVLQKIANCPGFKGNLFTAKDLGLGIWGLQSEWYQQLLKLPLGCQGSSRQLTLLEEEIRTFRQMIEAAYPLPETDLQDYITERFSLERLAPNRFDFSHLTQTTAERLCFSLADIEARLLNLSDDNDELMI